MNLMDERRASTAGRALFMLPLGGFGHLDLVVAVTLTERASRLFCPPSLPAYQTPLSLVQREGYDLLERFVVDRQTPCI
jgi:hypothetical protein